MYKRRKYINKKEIVMEKIKELLQPVADAIGLDVTAVTWMALALVVIIVAIIVIVIVACAKKKGAKEEETVAAAPAPAPASAPTPVVAERVAPTPAPVVEEKAAPAPTIKEEKAQPKPVPAAKPAPKAEKPAAKVAPKAEEKKAAPAPKKAAPKAKEEVKPAVEEKAAPKKFVGKWLIEKKSEGEYISKLLASNGEVMLSSEIYSSEEGARNGVQTIVRGVENGNFIIYQDKSKNYYYKLKSTNNRIICVGEIYKEKDQCMKAVESVKRIAADCDIVDGVTDTDMYVAYTPATIPEGGMKGKWKVEVNDEGKYSAKLYANNGQLMLATEEVSVKKSAENAIESVKKNATEGNFVIDHDKFGRFYYKLRTAQKSVICIGEAYESLDSCVSAIESVRRFAINSTIEK